MIYIIFRLTTHKFKIKLFLIRKPAPILQKIFFFKNISIIVLFIEICYIYLSDQSNNAEGKNFEIMADVTISTAKIRASVGNGYSFVRNLEEKGGVIDALVPEKKESAVYQAIEANKESGFSAVWEALNKIKGVRFEYKSN